MIYSLLVPATSAGTQSIIDMIFIYALMWLIIPIAIILIVYHINKKNKKH